MRILFCFVLSMIFFGEYHEPQKNNLQITLLPIDEIKPKYLELIKEKLEDYYKSEVIIGKRIRLPEEFNQKDTLDVYETISVLDKTHLNQKNIVIGITNKKLLLTLYQNISSLIRGYTDYDTRSIIISTYLISKEIQTEKEFERILAKVAKHEIGHVLGLGHCEFSDKCFMVFSFPHPDLFYASSPDLCSKCQDSLKTYLNLNSGK